MFIRNNLPRFKINLWNRITQMKTCVCELNQQTKSWIKPLRHQRFTSFKVTPFFQMNLTVFQFDLDLFLYIKPRKVETRSGSAALFCELVRERECRFFEVERCPPLIVSVNAIFQHLRDQMFLIYFNMYKLYLILYSELV